MRAVDIIMKKRAGGELSQEEIQYLIKGYVDKSIPEYQVSAWLMAVYFQGMSFTESGYLTRAMIDSGKVFALEGLKGPLVDKHSTGGVGDKVSLILAPLAAACGLQVPMMSGRALGHTGGTLDKLDSIPGFSTALTEQQFIDVIGRTGYSMTGQSKEVVPADRLMYALRDVTATVESVPLITASIMSKKFAEGAESLVFDVKCGSGAFMKNLGEAETLAESLVKTGASLGKKIVAVLTSMEEPLGRMVGNFLEVEESIQALKGEGPDDLMEVTLRLTAWMLVTGGIARSVDEGLDLCRKALASGEAYNAFLMNCRAQGADTDIMLSMCGSARAALSRDVKAQSGGVITAIDAFKVGLAGVVLGVGRNKTTDPVEPLTGVEFLKKRGDRVEKGDVICRVYAEDSDKMAEAHQMVSQAVTLGSEAPPKGSLILKEIQAL